MAYVIEGKGYFCKEKKPFTYEVEGINYFDMQRESFVSNGTVVLFEDGDHIVVSTDVDGSEIPPHFRKTY